MLVGGMRSCARAAVRFASTREMTAVPASTRRDCAAAGLGEAVLVAAVAFALGDESLEHVDAAFDAGEPGCVLVSGSVQLSKSCS